MARLFPWDPWVELEILTEKTQHPVEDQSCTLSFATPVKRTIQFKPLADVLELEHEFQILMELPGLTHQDVTVEAHGKEVIVFGERRQEHAVTKAAFQIMERSYGCFARKFVFPMPVQNKEIHAIMKDGLLMIRVVKTVSDAHSHFSIPVHA